MKKLIVIVNDLEGSGKSTFARSFQHLLTNQGVKHMFITTDEQDMDDNFSGDYWDFDEQLEISQLIMAMDRNEVVLLDVRSGYARVWEEFFEKNEVDTVLSEIDASMTLVIPCHDSERCHNELVELAELFSDSADYVVPHFPCLEGGNKEQAWKGSYAAKVTEYLGAMHFEMPQLSNELATALEAHDLSLSQALAQLDQLPRFLEVAAMQWLEQISTAINGTGDYVLPKKKPAKTRKPKAKATKTKKVAKPAKNRRKVKAIA
jgi:hypothetical protein